MSCLVFEVAFITNRQIIIAQACVAVCEVDIVIGASNVASISELVGTCEYLFKCGESVCYCT